MIPQFHEHAISEDGLIITNVHGREIKQALQMINGKTTGYVYATLLASDYSYLKRVAVHRLVAFTYLDPPPSDKHVWINHKDGDKTHNHYSNLEWTTISQNIQHAYDIGLKVSKKGAEHHRFGKTIPAAVKFQMSLAKLGEKHPKFQGYYVVNGHRYPSANQASKALGISCKTIIERCKHPKNKDYYFLPKSY